MKKIVLVALLVFASMAAASLADPIAANVTVRFWDDLNSTTPHINNFMWVYARSDCPEYEPPLCTLRYYHGQYLNGTANFVIEEPDNYTFYIVSGTVSFASNSSPPSVFNYDIWQPVDYLGINLTDNYNLNYYWNSTRYGSYPFFSGSFDWNFWLSVAGICILIVATVLTAYLSNSGVATIAVMVLVYILLKILGVLSGAIFFGIF